MNIVLTVIEIVAPVFLLGAVGYVWVKLGIDYPMAFVTRLAMNMGIPCLMFTALMQTNLDPKAIANVLYASLLAYFALTLAIAVIVFLGRLDVRTYLSPLIFGNTGNLGLPLALFAFGDEGLGLALVVFAGMAVYNFTFGVWVVSGSGSPLRVLKEPIVLATLLGALFLWQDWETPRFLTNALELIGQTAIPLMLITLGVAVARLSPAGMSRAAVLSVAKAALSVAIAWSIGLWWGLAPVPFAIVVLQLATPVAVSSYLLSERYQTGPDDVAGLVVASTLLSVAVLPAILFFVI